MIEIVTTVFPKDQLKFLAVMFAVAFKTRFVFLRINFKVKTGLSVKKLFYFFVTFHAFICIRTTAESVTLCAICYSLKISMWSSQFPG